MSLIAYGITVAEAFSQREVLEADRGCPCLLTSGGSLADLLAKAAILTATSKARYDLRACAGITAMPKFPTKRRQVELMADTLLI